MKYRFDALLRLRKNEENLRQKEMAQANAHLILQEDRLQFMKSVEKQTKRGLDERVARDPDINVLLLHSRFYNGLNQQKYLQERIIGEASSFREGRRRGLAEAMKKRRTLELLKERQVEKLRAAERKRETDFMDEVAGNMKRARRI